MATCPVLAIVCPVHNEAVTIPLFFGRLRPVIDAVAGRYAVQLVFLNNASTDASLEAIARLRRHYPETYVVSMSRNVGYQRSLDCGLRTVTGDLFVVIDVDCEDPPELILDFLATHERGYDIVYGERVDRPEPVPVKAARKLFYRLLRGIADEEIILDMAEFSLFTREVRDAVIEENTSFPFIRAAIGRVGFRRAAIPFARQHRVAGTSHYNLVSMSVFAMAGILASSTLLLRLPLYVLPAWMALLGGLGAGFVETGSPWLALAAALVFAGYVGAALAFTALYVARSYKNGLHRPNAFIDRRNSVLQSTVTDRGNVTRLRPILSVTTDPAIRPREPASLRDQVGAD